MAPASTREPIRTTAAAVTEIAATELAAAACACVRTASTAARLPANVSNAPLRVADRPASHARRSTTLQLLAAAQRTSASTSAGSSCAETHAAPTAKFARRAASAGRGHLPTLRAPGQAASVAPSLPSTDHTLIAGVPARDGRTLARREHQLKVSGGLCPIELFEPGSISTVRSLVLPAKLAERPRVHG